MNHKLISLISCFLFLTACEKQPNAQKIIDKAIEVSGASVYENSLIQFDFRDHHYLVERDKEKFKMMRVLKTDTSEIKDVLDNTSFSRFINEAAVVVHDTMAFKYKESINSVTYFALLPYRLNDAAVQKKFLEEKQINERKYYKIQVTFQEEGGGVDFEDIYVYWINSATYKIDFLAYSFIVNDGGFRIREAYNERYVGGIRFVDYINYKPLVKVESVAELDELFINKQLEELSKIELKNISVSSAAF